jgi:quinol monooxygenase YgiN
MPTVCGLARLGGGPDGWDAQTEHDPLYEICLAIGRVSREFGGFLIMVTVGLLIRLHAKPGKEAALADFLEGVMPLIRDEPATTALFGVRFGPSEFGIFNVFPDEAARRVHIEGNAAMALFSRADELLASPPTIEPIDIVAAKLPAEAAA